MSEQNQTTTAAVNTEVLVMNQIPLDDSAVRGESPLHHADLPALAQAGAKTGGVHFKEHGLLGHLILRCNPKNTEQLAVAESILGVALPLEKLRAVEAGAISVRWISPDEWLIVLPGLQAFAVETEFRNQMQGHYSLVNNSGGATLYELSGANVVDMLKKSTPVDLHLNAFPVGKVVTTVFAKGSAVLRRTGEQRFELIVRRSFADYFWLWIQDASREYGLVVES